ncbi:MAG: DUF4124 domain-containing protein [Porticoccaceae bacterium]|nr:DUF4124 domain-containing protein [Porticoccaceae bacterium]
MRLVAQIVSAKWLAAMLAVVSQGLLAEVYKLVDQEGNTTYTDQPAKATDRANAEKLPPVNQLPTLLAPSDEAGLTETAEGETESFVRYSSALILSPENDSIIPHNQISIVIQLALSPQLQAGHRVQFWFDGAPQGQAVATTTYQISDIERGSYSLSARVFNAQGQLLISTAAVEVHVKRNFARN